MRFAIGEKKPQHQWIRALRACFADENQVYCALDSKLWDFMWDAIAAKEFRAEWLHNECSVLVVADPAALHARFRSIEVWVARERLESL